MIARNLPDLFVNTANQNRNKNKVAFEYRLRRNEPYRSILWGHLSTIVEEVTYGLVELGIKKGDNVAILSYTRYEWAICDLAILSCGGVVIPIYPTLGEPAVNYILNNSECEIIILEDKGQLQKIRSQWNQLPKIRYAIVIEDLGDIPQYDPKIISFKNLKDKGKLNFSKDPNLMESYVENIDINDLATIIYTSGTTGVPKGVMITHKNILSVVSVLPKMLPIKSNDKFLSFLPLSHVFERVGGLFYAISTGTTVCYCSNVDQIGSALKDSNATIMLVVPRLLEKMYSKIQSQIEALPDFKKNIFHWACDIGKKYIVSKNIFNIAQYFIANILVFSSMRKKIAPELKCFVSGGAPLSKEIAEFFWIIGMPVLQGYGLTETSAPATVNTLKENRLDTVGKHLPNVEIKIATDGEILIKGPNVFLGYYKDSNATKKVFTGEWFMTGDIGVIDEDGFLKITDRKKDIIKNSGGKIIAPQNIENALKVSPYINNVVIIGDKKKYLSALITLDYFKIEDFAKKQNIHYDEITSVYNHPDIVKLVDEEIKLRTAEFADYEQIRKFTILQNDFSIENGEITPTLKVKRKFVEEKYKILINAMYPVFLAFLLFFSFSLLKARAIEDNYPGIKRVNGYENNLAKELTHDEFINHLLVDINEQRSLKGLLPLSSDLIAMRVANNQSNDLIKKGYLSYYNLNNQSPDERYTLLGGTGATIEIVKGFELEKNIKLTEVLVQQLIAALTSTQDDSNIFFSPYITHVGGSFSLSPDRKKFVSVIEFVTKGGEFEPIKPAVKLGEKLNISGVVNPPFKFKAVSIAYFDMPAINNAIDDTANYTFDNEDLVPYFPPQDYIAFTDTAKSNLLNVLKGIGIVGAIAGSPFTGGASAIFAPALLSSIQNGPPKEIPLKHGIKVRGSRFTGEIELNHQGMTGLYFVSVLGELPNISFPIVISRRTVRVNSPLLPISKCRVRNAECGV